MFTLYFILSHLFGDFVLQPSWLYKMKMRSEKGVLLHATICALVIPIMLFPYIHTVALWGITLLTGVTHFVFDVTKIVHEKKQDAFSLTPFVFDQIGHLSVAVLAGLYLTNAAPDGWIPLDGWLGKSYADGSFALVISAVILVSYVTDIVRYQVMRTKNPYAEYTRDYPGMLKRTLAFAVFTLLLIVYYVASQNGFQPGMIGLMVDF